MQQPEVSLQTSSVESISAKKSITNVYDIINSLDNQKQELVKSIGLGGLLYFPCIKQLNRKFSIWLMSRVDALKKQMSVHEGISISLHKDDVNKVFGVPCSGLKVTGSVLPNQKTIELISTEYLSVQLSSARRVKTVQQIIEKKYDSEMSQQEKVAFKTAFVIYIMSTLLAPGAKFDYVSVEFWNALADPDRIGCYDWSEYILDKLLDSCMKVRADLNAGRKSPGLTGCAFFLQVNIKLNISLP